MNLYEITDEYLHVFSELMEMEDIDPRVVEDTLASFKDDFETKAIAVASHIKNLEADIEIFKNHEKKINEKRKSIERKYIFFKNYLMGNMIKVKCKKIKGKLFNITLTKPQKIVKITNEDSIPLDFIDFERKIRKDLLKKPLVEGQEIPGAELGDGQHSLRIR